MTLCAGCRPQYVQPVTDARWGIAHGLRPADVDAALRDARMRGRPATAVLVVSPTYYGYVSDVPGGPPSSPVEAHQR